MQDDIYENYFIPKGTQIMANIWCVLSHLEELLIDLSRTFRAITRDEEMYPDPSTFDPNRHLGDNPQSDPFQYVFGFGRRLCPGRTLAKNMMTMLTSPRKGFILRKCLCS